AKTGKVVAEAGTKLVARQLKKFEEDGLKEIVVQDDELIGGYLALDMFDNKTGEVLSEAGDEVTKDTLKGLDKAGVTQIQLLGIDHVNVGAYIRNTLQADK